MITIKCLYCGKKFRTHACYSRRGGNKFCSYKCYHLNTRATNPNMRKCKICSKLFYSKPYQRQLGRAQFCSIKCASKFRTGKEFFGKKRIGISYHGDGYIYIKNHKHPFATKSGYVMEHRLIIEKHFGRYLTRKEIVHHKNDNPSDNRIKNLKLFPNQYPHMLHHKKLNQRLKRKASTSILQAVSPVSV